jgi:predicted Zn-dependent protease
MFALLLAMTLQTTFTLNSSLPSAPESAVAWSKGTDVEIATGSSGPRLITAVYSDAPGGNSAYAGYAVSSSDGTCKVEINRTIPVFYGYAAERMTLEHEIGHCLGLPHNSVKRSIMNPVLDPHNPLPGPSSYDRRQVNLRY